MTTADASDRLQVGDGPIALTGPHFGSLARHTLRVSVLAPTPADRLLDARGRPYFLWDVDMTTDELRARLVDPDPAVRAYFLGKLMRQAKPDDVFVFVSLRAIVEQFSAVERYLGKSREFWAWLIERWGNPARGPG